VRAKKSTIGAILNTELATIVWERTREGYALSREKRVSIISGNELY
jgi:hypothetical protein